MSNFLPIYFKATGERFNVPYELQTTVDDLIKYVCIHTIEVSNTNSEDYYIAMNNSDVLDRNRTVEEIRLDQLDRFVSLDMCIKTRVLMKRISEARMKLWETPDKQVPEKVEQTTTTQRPANTDKSSSFSTQQQVPVTTREAIISTEKHSIGTLSNNGDASSEVHILVCGGPKVGKSSLINALCGFPVAKTHTIGLDRCTEKTSYYQLDNIYFWDTPGIQQWSQLDIDSYLNSSALRQTPLCMFYCASPGSFTKLKQLNMLLDECIDRRHIFCVLVVTNMFADVSRCVILDEFKALLARYVKHDQQMREERGVWYYGQVGLCTMVNSQEYVNEDTGRQQPQQGVNELVLALMTSLNGSQQLAGWLSTIEKNRKFWLDNQEELYRLTKQIT